MTRKIMASKNYRLLQRHSSENRPVDLKKHKKLVESMKLYGYIPGIPIVAVRDRVGNLIVKDGQHRLMIAEMLDIAFHYTVEEIDFDIAIVNSTAKTWVLRDYAQKFAANGKTDYADGLEFAERHGLPIGTAFALLSGTTCFSNVQNEFISGQWRIKDVGWASDVASIYSPLVAMSAAMRNQRFIEACMSVCRVKDFKAGRLIANAERCREKLVAYSTRDAYLDMLESVYNFGRRDLLGLKAAATMAMKKRSAVEAKKGKKQVAAEAQAA